jgi:hypothetical protein
LDNSTAGHVIRVAFHAIDPSVGKLMFAGIS